MKLSDRYEGILRWFSENMPNAQTELQYSTPFELLVAVVLSAQCTDKRVNQVTPALFEVYPSPEAMAQATPEELFAYIKSCSYPNSKAKHLAELSRMLHEQYADTIPNNEVELMKLPGVGRKTANVLLSILYEQPRIAVDTHVYRVARRIGLAPQTANTPLKVEQALIRHIPADLRAISHHWLILHGRYVCLARTPKCSTCGIAHFCRYFTKNTPSPFDE